MARLLDKETAGLRRTDVSGKPRADADRAPSRQTAGIRGRTLIVNLPGRPVSIGIYLKAVCGAVPCCIELIAGGFIDTDSRIVHAFRSG